MNQLLYADENFNRPVVLILRSLGHDVITVQEDGLAGSDDDVVLARAHSLGRIVLTLDRRDYERLHRTGQMHSGILSATDDKDHTALAHRVHSAMLQVTRGCWCIRVNKPPSPSKP